MGHSQTEPFELIGEWRRAVGVTRYGSCEAWRLGQSHVADTTEATLAQIAGQLERHVGGMATGRRAGDLVGVHTLVAEPQGIRGAGGLRRYQRRAVGAADLEVVTRIRERFGSSPRGGFPSTVTRRDEQAELIAAEAIWGAVSVCRVSEVPAETAEDFIAGLVAEAVVVFLEAVEVEHGQEEFALGVRLRDTRLEGRREAHAGC